jgi:hypothetical protein
MSDEAARATPRRVFLHEPGWKIALKVGSEREFCYAMIPGQDYYHRLLDGEVFLHNTEERYCLACAERRGLLAFDPKGLREPIPLLEIAEDPEDDGEVRVFRVERAGDGE